MIEKIINLVKQFKDNGSRYGNDILYSMSENSDMFNENHLSSKIWLIGRSYAASPERRSYKGLHSIKNASDGRGSFFDEISHYMINGFLKNDYKKLTYNLKFLASKSYAYDYSNTDAEIIVKSIECVQLFNELIKSASEKFDDLDKKINEFGEIVRCKNQISFCSKFLHFHCRDVVFIIDRYSFNGAYALFNYRGKKTILIENNVIDNEKLVHFRNLTDVKNFEEEILRKLRSPDDVQENEEDKIINYVKHVLRSYRLGCYIKNNGEDVNPRIIDSLLLRTKII